MNIFRTLFLIVFSSLSLGSYAYKFPSIDSSNSGKLEISEGVVVPAEWNSNYTDGIRYAEAHNLPVILVSSGSALCSYCNTFKNAVVTEDFRQWAAQRNYVLILSTSVELENMTVQLHKDFANSNFAKKLWPDQTTDEIYSSLYGNMSQTVYPTVCVFWPRGKSPRYLANFTARSSELKDVPGENLAQKVTKKIDLLIAEAYTGGTFKPGLVLESEAGSENTVWVPLVRNAASANVAANNSVIVEFPSKVAITNVVDWTVGQKEAFVKITIPTTLKVDEEINVNLFDGESLVESAQIGIIGHKENSVLNPYWIGEKTVDELGFGEWTMDLDVATNKVAKTIADGGKAYTLVMSAGPLWCPDCFGFEEDVLSKKAFTDWAKANNVALVLIDQPRWGLPGPSLLSWDYGNAEKDKGTGSAYLSRKGISPEAAAAVIERNTYLSQQLWLAPETTAVRLGNPNVLLVSPEGTVLGRMFMQETSDRHFDLDENLARLNELLLLGGESDNYASTTLLSLPVGVTSNVTMQINDRVAFYKLTGFSCGNLVLNVGTSIAASNPKISLCMKEDGKLTEVAAAAEGKYVVNPTLLEKELFVKVEVWSDVNDDRVIFSDTFTTSLAEISVLAELELVPGEISFVADQISCLEISSAGKVEVVRANGMSGRCEVTVSVVSNGVSEGRCDWVDRTIAWEDGETGVRTIEFALNSDTVFSGPENFVLALKPSADCPAAVSKKECVVTILDSEDPSFSKLEYAIDGYKNFAGEEILEVFNITEKGRVTLKKESGKLPSGVSLKYDTKLGKVVLSGTPKTPGTYTVTYTVSQNGKTGLPATITIVVDDPAVDNPFVGVKRDADIPLYAEVGGGEKVLAGRLNVSISKANKIRAKYYGTESKTVSFSGQWGSFDQEDNSAYASITTKKGEELDLRLKPDGVLEVLKLSGVANAFGEEFTGSQPIAADSAFQDYAGYYNVALPAILGDGETAQSAGTGYLTLTMTSKSYIKTGKMKYSGMLGNGTSISGYAYLEPTDDPDVAYLPIFVRKSKDLFSAVLQLKSGAATNAFSVADLQSVHRAEGVAAMHRHIEDGFDYAVECEAYGSYYEKNIKLTELCEVFAFDPVGMILSADMSAVSSDGSSYGKVDFGGNAILDASKNKFTLLNKSETRVKSVSYSKSTGIVSGSVKIAFESGKTATGTFKGILQPGWFEDCGCGDVPAVPLVERPFASGTLYYTDRITTVVNGRTRTVNVKRSAPFMIEASDVTEGGEVE